MAASSHEHTQHSNHSHTAYEDDETLSELQNSAVESDSCNETDPLLPLFSAAHLDTLPVHRLTHEVRSLVQQRCDTTLSWEQLRSPQISAFLIKPLQHQIRANHFSRASLFVLLANALQFTKEAQKNPGNIGVCGTRARVCELLALRLLREFSARELVDALSYDFHPLNSSTDNERANIRGTAVDDKASHTLRSVRASALELGIRAQAKKFLAHPLVVQHLEAIWAGFLVFHCAADSLHRYPSKPKANHTRHFAATHGRATPPGPSNEPLRNTSQSLGSSTLSTIRRSVTAYDPSTASVFKLSRLRVPRYRQFFSLMSYSIMLCLFLIIVFKRPVTLSALELAFWVWSSGFILAEVLDFCQQGPLMFVESFWNVFDIGILLLFLVFYVLRLYGILVAPSNRQEVLADMAYDVLASAAVLLCPRAWSGLIDRYQYFSQLLIAFRLMIRDLAGVLGLMTISCSGFFVAFAAFSFGPNDFNGRGVAYAMFQILMTILISVLTNSFMTVVKNANEEYQFLFAINTISAVKSDALFSYIAPFNILGWVLLPLRVLVPFHTFVRVNRTIIKATHLPILLAIFCYERALLARAESGHPKGSDEVFPTSIQPTSYGLVPGRRLFSPRSCLREASQVTFLKDRALEEVFRKPLDNDHSQRTRTGLDEYRNKSIDSKTSIDGMETSPRRRLNSLGTAEPSASDADRSMTFQRLAAKRRSGSRSLGPTSAANGRFCSTDSSRQHLSENSEPVASSLLSDTGSFFDSPRNSNRQRRPTHRAQGTPTRNEPSSKENQKSDVRRIPVVDLSPNAQSPASLAAFQQKYKRQMKRHASSNVHTRHSSVNTIIFKPLSEPSAASEDPQQQASIMPAAHGNADDVQYERHAGQGSNEGSKQQVLVKDYEKPAIGGGDRHEIDLRNQSRARSIESTESSSVAGNIDNTGALCVDSHVDCQGKSTTHLAWVIRADQEKMAKEQVNMQKLLLARIDELSAEVKGMRRTVDAKTSR